MREIKFRAWDKKLKRMCDVIYLDFSAKEIIVYHSDEEERSNWLKLDRFVLLQYTGLKDKNDKEIYEGDVVKAKVAGPYASDAKIKMEGEIIYYEPFACFEVKTKECGQPTMSIFDNFEIIGNKYENPELLKKGE